MILITHTDADGYGCRYILEKAEVEFDAVIHSDYGSEEFLIEKVKQLKKTGIDVSRIMITDLSLKSKTLEELYKFSSIHVIDHHITTAKAFTNELKDFSIDLNYDLSMSATKITATVFHHMLNIDEVGHIDKLVDCINAGDIYVQDNWFTKGLTLSDIIKNEDVMLYDKIKEIKSLEDFEFNNKYYNEYYEIMVRNFFESFITNPYINSLSNSNIIDEIFEDSLISEYSTMSIFEKIIDLNVNLIKTRLANDEAIVIDNGNYKVIVLDSLAKLSYLSFVFFKNNPDIDGLVFVNKETGTIAFRSNVNSDLDMSIMASTITNGNGGGHKHAAGGKFQDIMGYKTYKELCIDRVKDYLENDL